MLGLELGLGAGVGLVYSLGSRPPHAKNKQLNPNHLNNCREDGCEQRRWDDMSCPVEGTLAKWFLLLLSGGDKMMDASY